MTKNRARTFGLFGSMSHETLSAMSREEIKQHITAKVTMVANTRITTKDGATEWKYLQQSLLKYHINVRYTVIDAQLNVRGIITATFEARRKSRTDEVTITLTSYDYGTND
jgi:hypothetical protein